VHWASTGHETQFSSKFGAKLSFPCPCFSWMPSTNHCCCFLYCSYKCSRASCNVIPSLSISYPYLITFHDCGDNSQEGMKYQKRGATPASQGMTLRITLLSTMLKGLEPFPETTTRKQLNAINSSFSCDFNKNATPPCSWAFTDDCWLYKGHFRTPQMKERQSMTQVLMSKP